MLTDCTVVLDIFFILPYGHFQNAQYTFRSGLDYDAPNSNQ